MGIIIVILLTLLLIGIAFGQLFPQDDGPQVFAFSDDADWKRRRREAYERQNTPISSQEAPGRDYQPIDEESYWRQVPSEPDEDYGEPIGRARQINPPRVVPESLRWFGLGADATKRDVKHAYHERAKREHPDRGGTNADMQDLNAWYDAAMRDAKR